jgi:hypothetical protein
MVEPGAEKIDPVKPSATGHDIKKPGGGDFVPELLRAQEQIREERRQNERLIVRERERASFEIGKIRQEADKRVTDILQENRTLLRTLARLQTEKEALEQDVMMLRAKLSLHENGHVPAVHARPVAQAQGGISLVHPDAQKLGPLAVPLGPSTAGFSPFQGPTPQAPAEPPR